MPLVTLNKRTDIMQAAKWEDRLQVREAISAIAELQSSMAELEDRSWNNTRIFSSPEEAQHYIKNIWFQQ